MSWRVGLRLSGVDRNQPFAEDCETLVVNLHGCALQCPRPLRPGTSVQLEVAGRLLKGWVMDSVSFGDDQARWMLGIALEQAGNHWGIQYPPEDWGTPAASSTATGSQARPAQTSPGPRVGAATTNDVRADTREATAAPVPLRPQTVPPPVATQAPVDWQAQKPSPPPVPAAPQPPPAPAAGVADVVLQEIRTQLLQLQQAQATQETILLQERTERLAARAAAEQAIADQLERVRQAKEYVESLVCSFPSLLEAQAQEQVQSILHRLQPQASRAELEKLVHDAQQATEAVLEQRAARLGDELRRQLEQMVEEQRQASDVAYAAATSQLQALEERANQLTSLVDVELQKHADEIIAETVAEIRKELQTSAVAPQSPAPPQQIEAGPGLEALVRQAADATAELRNTLQAVRQEHRMNEAATACLHHRSEAVQAWLAQETEKFQQTVREAFRDAGSEIRGRIAQAVESASQPLEACRREIQQQMSALAQQHVDELQRQADVVRQRLQASSEESQAKVAAALQARVDEALERFTRDAQRLAQSKT